MLFFNRLSLSSQLIIVFIIVFLVIIATFGTYSYTRHVKNLSDEKLNSLATLSKSISATLSENVYSNNYSAIEHKLLSLNDISDIHTATLYDNTGLVLAELIRDDAGKLLPTFKYGISKQPVNKIEIAHKGDGCMVTRVPIDFSAKTIAWMELKSSPAIREEIQRKVFTELVVVSGVILFFTSITIIIFLRLRLRALNKISEFANHLPLANGNTINISNTSHELTSLMNSLNWASKEIQLQNNKHVINKQVLEDRVAERTKELEKAKDVAEKASTAKSEFLSRMSHELRTPMNAVLGFSQIMQMDKTIDANQRRHVTEIVNAGTHLLGLIDEILDLSTIAAGKIGMEPEHIFISDVVNKALPMLEATSKEYSIPIKYDVDSNIDTKVQADPQHLNEVIINILSNAIKYNKAGGEVWIDSSKDNNYFYLQIHDTGHGLSREQLLLIFEPFNRAGAEASSIPGTGIGLSISKKIMLLMDGDITVKSQPNVGTCFTIKIPLSNIE